MASNFGQPVPDRTFSIGAIMGRAFGVMFANPVAVFGIAFLFGAIPQLVMTLLLPSNPGSDFRLFLANGFLYLVSLLVYVLFSALAQGAIVRATGAYIVGTQASIADCLRVGLVKALPLIALAILTSLGVMLGFLLLIVPGIILALMWAVATPALVMEDIGVVDAFGRSRFLTKGARWNVLFLMIVVAIAMWLVMAVAVVPTLILGGGMAAMGTAPTAISMIVDAVTTTFGTALWSTMQTSLYFALRDWREGPQTDALADVFA